MFITCTAGVTEEKDMVNSRGLLHIHIALVFKTEIVYAALCLVHTTRVDPRSVNEALCHTAPNWRTSKWIHQNKTYLLTWHCRQMAELVICKYNTVYCFIV